MGDLIFFPLEAQTAEETIAELESVIPKITDTMLLKDLLKWADYASRVLDQNREMVTLEAMRLEQMADKLEGDG